MANITETLSIDLSKYMEQMRATGVSFSNATDSFNNFNDSFEEVIKIEESDMKNNSATCGNNDVFAYIHKPGEIDENEEKTFWELLDFE
jgi:hypothetical protein